MKKIVIGIVVLLATLALVACGPSNRGGNDGGKLVQWYELSPDAAFDPEEEVTIRFWHRMGAQSQELLQGWIAEFEAEYPNIKVIEEKAANNYDGLVDKIALSIAAGVGPDIAESYPDHVARYAQANAPLALNHFISHPTLGFTQAEIEDFLPGLWAEGSSYDTEGTILSLPFTKSSEALFYNSTYFETHNYEVPETWDELFAIAEDIKEREAGATPFGYDSESNLFITGAEQWGAPYTGYNEETGRGEVLFNNDETKAMVKYFKDKVDRGLMVVSGAVGDGFFASDIMKTNKDLYMYVGSTGGTRYAYIGASNQVIADGYRVGVAPLPSFDGENRRQIQQGPNINLFRKNSEQQMIAAWMFAKFITSTEKTVEFALPSGYAPIRYSAYETQAWLDYVAAIDSNPNPNTSTALQNKLVKEAIEIFLNHGDIFFTSAVFNLSSKTREAVGQLMVKVMVYQHSGEENLNQYIDDEFQNTYDFILS